jgi:hypothetical protein
MGKYAIREKKKIKAGKIARKRLKAIPEALTVSAPLLRLLRKNLLTEYNG